MPASLEPIKRFKCTYKDCMASFDTEKEMKRHKKSVVEHDYCSKCDEDFASWDEYTEHKIYRPEKHYTACRICGEEFKSVAGMKKHVEISHPIDQKVSCIGCGETFRRASNLVEHIEFGHCKKISTQEFMGHLQHKYIIEELLEREEAQARFIQKTKYYGAAHDTEEGGGVSLSDTILDKGIPEMNAEILQPEKKLTGEPKMRVGERWPDLPSLKTSKASEDGTDTISAEFDRISLSGTATTTPKWYTPADSVASHPLRSSSKEARSPTPVTNTATNKTNGDNAWSAWAAGNAAKKLYPNAKATPVTEPWRNALEKREQDLQEEHGVSIFHNRFWDPTSPDYDADRFFQAPIGKYFCPFPRCMELFDGHHPLGLHIMSDHRLTQVQCPSCLKYFRSSTAVVAHSENPNGKCRLQDNDKFGQILDKLSGGFLGAKSLVRPDHQNLKSILVEDEDGELVKFRPPRVGYTQFEATKPSDWKGPQIRDERTEHVRVIKG